MKPRIAASVLALATGVSALLSATAIANAQQAVNIPQNLITYDQNPKVTLPLIICWNNGKKNFYIQMDASNRPLALQQGVNTVPQLSNAINAPGGATDDIYVFTNSTQTDQYNVIPSEPSPVGPRNANQQYTPLWRVSKITWKAGAAQTTLTSEAEVLKAVAEGLATREKTDLVINCPVLYTDGGGLLPHAVIHLLDGEVFSN